MNPIIQAMAGRSPIMARMGQARQMFQMLKASNNPQAFLNQMLSQNPQVNQIINQYGGDPKTAFYKYAEANGVDPNEIIGMMR